MSPEERRLDRAACLEFRDGTSHGFWEITLRGAEHTVRVGKVGTEGLSKVETFDSAEAARADAGALIRAKTKKGYAAVAQEVADATLTGIENVGGTHLLLGTENHLDTSAGQQLASISEYGDEDELDAEASPPRAIPVDRARFFSLGSGKP